MNTNKENEINASFSSARHGKFNRTSKKRQSAFSSDAASSYYFSDVPKTPAVKSARKQFQKRVNESLLLERQQEQDHTRDLNTLELESQKIGNDLSADTSLLLSPAPSFRQTPSRQDDTADLLNQLGDLNTTCTSNASSIISDNMNKSVLSDTTELTASNFVFCEKSRKMKSEADAEKKQDELEQRVKEVMEEKRRKKEMEEEQERQKAQLVLDEKEQSAGKDETVDGGDLDALLNESTTSTKTSNDETVDVAEIGTLQNQSVSTNKDDTSSISQQEDDTVDTAAMDELLNFDHLNDSNESNEDVEDLRDISTNQENKEADESMEEIPVRSDDEEKASSDRIEKLSENEETSQENVDLETTTNKEGAEKKVEVDKEEREFVVRQKASTNSSQKVKSIALSQSFATSPFVTNTRLSISQSIRRDSFEAGKRHSISGASPLSSQLYRNVTRSNRKLTASIQKSRQMRQQLRRGNRTSLPMKPIAPKAIENTNNALNATFDETNNGINDILTDLNANNDTMDETKDFSSPAKLDLSSKEDEQNAGNSKAYIGNLRLSNSGRKPERIYVASPARSTRSKKRMSTDADPVALSSRKRSDKKATPERSGRKSLTQLSLSRRFSAASQASSVNSIQDEDNTEMLMNYLVPGAPSVNTNEEDIAFPKNANLSQNQDTSMNPFWSQNSQDESISQLFGRGSEAQNENEMEASEQIPNSQETSATAIMTCTSEKAPLECTSPEDSVKTMDILKCQSENSVPDADEVNDSMESCETKAPARKSESSEETRKLLEQGEESSIGTLDLLQNKSPSSGSSSPFVPPSTTKSNKLSIESPLSCNVNSDDESIISADSNASSEYSSRIDGDDGATADTAALMDIMNDLGDDTNVFNVNMKKKRDRRSSMFSEASITGENLIAKPKSKEKIEIETANTQDLKGLLSDLDTRGSTLLPIQENYDNQSPLSCEQGKATTDTFRSPELCNKPKAANQTPKSILKTGRKQTPKRNVEFCPPTAAEYNIGSPAKNFTPMCSKITKDLFSIPKKSEEKSFLSKSSSNSYDEDDMDEGTLHEDETLGLQNNNNYVLEAMMKPNVSRESPSKDESDVSIQSENETRELSIKDTSMLRIIDGETQTIGLEDNIKGLLLKYNDGSSQHSSEEKSLSSSSEQNVNVNDEDQTLDLDSNMKDLLRGQSRNEGDDESLGLSSTVSSVQNSFESTEEQTVELDENMADILNVQADQTTENLPRDSNCIDTSFASLSSASSIGSRSDETEENTVDLDGKMTDLLKLQGEDGDSLESTEENCDKSSTFTSDTNSEPPRNTEEGTVDLDENMADVLKLQESESKTNLSFTGTLSLHDISMMKPIEGETIGLESDLAGVLERAAKADGESSQSEVSSMSDKSIHKEASFEKNATLTCNNVDTVELESDMHKMMNGITEPSFGTNDDTTISLNDVSILQKSEGDTIGLENDLKAMLDTAANMKEKSLSTIDIATVSQQQSSSSSRTTHFSNTSDLLQSLVQKVDGESSDISKSRRRSSRRFSLTPACDISSISPIQNESVHEAEQGSSVSEKDTSVENIIVDLSWRELSQHFLHEQNLNDVMTSKNDVLLEGANFIFSEYNSPETFGKITDFLQEVCSEIENSSLEDIKATDLVSDHLEDCDELILDRIQRALRGESGEECKEHHEAVLKELSDIVRSNINSEHIEWEIQVMQALDNIVLDISQGYDEDIKNLATKVGLADDIDQSLSIMSRQLVIKAREELLAQKRVSQKFRVFSHLSDAIFTKSLHLYFRRMLINLNPILHNCRWIFKKPKAKIWSTRFSVIKFLP